MAENLHWDLGWGGGDSLGSLELYFEEPSTIRLDLNDPPVTTGGIRGNGCGPVSRLDLNDPPVTTGGIRRRCVRALE